MVNLLFDIIVILVEVCCIVCILFFFTGVSIIGFNTVVEIIKDKTTVREVE